MGGGWIYRHGYMLIFRPNFTNGFHFQWSTTLALWIYLYVIFEESGKYCYPASTVIQQAACALIIRQVNKNLL